MGTERVTRPAGQPVHWPDAVARHACEAGQEVPAQAGPGAALPGPVQERMGARFGHDFSDVRVHTGADADASARAVDAQAYTVGRDVVFSQGTFAPETREGERLLAHELGHVVEQRTGSHRLARQVAGQAVAAPNTGQRDYVTAVIASLRGAAEHYGARGPIGPRDQRIAPLVSIDLAAVPGMLRNWLKERDEAAKMITTHLDGDPVLTTQLREGYRDAVRAVLTSASSRVQRGQPGEVQRPSTDELYLQHQQLIHDWAWPEAQLDPHRNELLDALPEAERAQIREDTADVNIGGLANVFSPNALLRPLPRGTTITLGQGIPVAAQPALRNLAQFLVTEPPVMLGVNRTTTLRLDLSAHGGTRSTYRFTQVRHAAVRRQAATSEVLVEQLAALGPERDRTLVRPGGQELFDRHRFVRDASWTSGTEYAQLLGALATIPESMLAGLDGIRFLRVAAIPDAAAEYRLAPHEIAVADNAFASAGALRAYQGPRQAAPDFDRLIAHEIGHAIDQAALRGPLTASNQAKDAQNAFLRQHGTPRRRGGFLIPPAQVAAWNQVRQAERAARTALEAVDAESGARFDNGQATDTLRPRTRNDFRDAAGHGGARRITTYSDKGWREYYAEAFALYVTDPEGLKRLRPHVYDFFARHHPDPDRLP
ncbi:DUF4157 domain-containing protein [Amycolatopsis sp. NPDC059021]|uniref:eCIS core domain-containing protein n=1 Tax=Amycolatopsis sp. NPDC059021 TaxID=3346704 RepID=UPI0036704F25